MYVCVCVCITVIPQSPLPTESCMSEARPFKLSGLNQPIGPKRCNEDLNSKALTLTPLNPHPFKP